MKRIIQTILLLLALLLPATATAYDFMVNGIYYNRSGNKAQVTYKSYVNDTYSSDYSGNITIPSTVTYGGITYNVVAIGYRAFSNCSGLISVTIPNSVTSIGNYAFYYCSGLVNVNIPSLVTTIGDNAFNGCSGLTSVSIPSLVTTIGDDAFFGCSGLTSVNIPSSVVSIGYDAFDGCSGMTSVQITDLEAWCNIKFSDNNANPLSCAHHLFLNGTEVKHLLIPSTISTIGSNAFYGCSGLTGVTIPSTITSIGSDAFSECSGLTSITIPSSVSTIGNSVFNGCSALASVTIPNSVTSIGNNAFYGCSSLTSITIPNSVTFIGNSAFENCTGLTGINIPNSLASISYRAFYKCTSLASVTISNSVITISDYAFYNCDRLKTVIWDAVNCTSIGSTSFNTSLTALQFGNGVEHIPAGMPTLAMSGKTLVLPNSVKTIASGAFKGTCGAVVIGDNIENIAVGAFPSGISVAYVSATDPRPCGEGAFVNPQTLYVPTGSRMRYFTSQGWGEFANIVEEAYVRAVIIKLNKSSVAISKGETAQLTATLQPSGVSNTSVTWVSMNPAVATVSSTGLVTAVAMGETDIVAMIDNVRATCHVAVSPLLVESLTLSDTQLSLEPNGMHTLIATVLPADADNKTLEWIIPDNDVIVTQVVNNTRLNIGAIGTGMVTITVRTTDGSNLSATCTVSVQVHATSIALNMTSAEMSVGETMLLTTTIQPSNATNNAVTWSTSNGAVAIVNNNGLVAAVGPGVATITATTADGSNLSATCDLIVKQLVESLYLNESSAELAKGETLQLSATVLPANATNKTVTWTSSDPVVANVDDNGLVTAITHGTAIITATTTDVSNLSASCEVTVLPDLSDFDNYLSMNDTSAFSGETIVIPVMMTNTESIVSFQTDIFLPEGLEIVKEDGDYLIDPSGRMTRTHSLMSDDVSNGAVRVLCYSSNYKPFTGNSGDDLFYITVKVADNAEADTDYTIQLKNTLFTNSNFEEIAAPDVAANVHTTAYLLGDANASGTVTVTDVVVTSQYVLELNPSPFIFSAADVNGDNNITVTDVTRIAWMVLNPTQNAPRRAPALYNNGDCMSAGAIRFKPGETRKVSILLDNAMAYTAFQLDLDLPDGLTAGNFQLTDRAGGHALAVNSLDNGDLRALCYSPELDAINGNDGALLTFDVMATSSIEDVIGVKDIELVTADCQTVLLDSFTIGVNSTTSISELNSAKTIARVDYYNVAGQRVDHPESGVTLVVTTYTDGTRTTSKVIK